MNTLPATVEKEVLFKPFPKQEEFIEAALSGNYSFILYGGAIRGGKTYAMLALFIVLSRVFPGSRWAIVRKDLPTIKRNLLPSWDKIKPTSFIKSYNQSTQTVTFNNGSQIIFFPENHATDKDKDRWKGLEVNGFGFEEINECQQSSLEKAFERAGSYIIKGAENQPKPIVVGTCNPTQGWVKQMFYTPWKEKTLKPGWLYIQSRIYDNIPFLEANPYYLASIKESMSVYAYMVFVDGDWDVTLKTGGEFFRKFELKLHVKPVNYDLDEIIFASIDSNVYPHIAISLWQIIKKDEKYRIRQIEELPAEDPENTASQAGLKIVNYLRDIGYKLRVVLHGDKSTKNRNNIDDNKRSFFQIINETLQTNGFRTEDKLPSSMPPVSGVADFVNAIFEGKIPGLSIEIGEHCKVSINDYIKTKTDVNGGMLKTRVPHPTITGLTFEPHGHLCFTGETLIYTNKGLRPIYNIQPGDMVFTRKGFKKVLKKWNNGLQQVNTFKIGTITVSCTPKHRFWTKEFGFKEINTLTGLKTFCILDACKPILLNTEEKGLSDIRKVKSVAKILTIVAGSRLMAVAKKLGIMFINTCAKLEKYPPAIMSIILMKIRSIMNYPIMNVLKSRIMLSTICLTRIELKCQKRILKQPGLQQLHGISQTHQQNGTNNMSLIPCLLKHLRQIARNAELNLKQIISVHQGNIFARPSINGDTRQESSEINEISKMNQNAPFVEKKLSVSCIAQKHVIMQEVYDLEVEDEHEYFANGILVHNCDTAKDFIVQSFPKEYVAFIHRHAAIQPGGISQIKRASAKKNLG